MSYNFLDKTGLTYFYDKIKTIFAKKSEIPTKTSQLTNDSAFNSSSDVTAGTIDTLAAFTSGKPGRTGSISLTKKSSGVGSEIPAGWYNYYFAPHRTGSGGDNDQYGTILLTPMNFAGKSWILRRSNSANAISEVKSIITNDLFKTSLITNDAAFIKNSAYYINIHPENSPVLIPFIHNDIAFLLKRGGSAKIYYDNVETSLDISNVFDGSGSYWAINPTGVTQIIIELTLHQTFSWTNTIYFDFGAAGWRAKHVKIEVMNTNYSQDVWTQKYNNTNNGSGNGMVVTSHQPVGASNQGGGFNKVRFTFDTWNTATIFRISQLGIYNYGSKGVRETYMSRGIDDYIFRNITPNSNNTYNLGSSSNKWANVYATTFNGNATSATKATGDKNGNDITTTYQPKLTPGSNITITNNTIAATDTTYSVATTSDAGLMSPGDKNKVDNIDKLLTNENLNNLLSTGTYYAGGGNTVSNKPTGVDAFGLKVFRTANGFWTQELIEGNTTPEARWTRQQSNNTWSSWTKMLWTDTTYTSKAAASGGTDVSLVTTGEKYTWNSKTSNTGTVTSVAVKMNNTTKGTVTTSGTIDLGTVITSHQDISGKVNVSNVDITGQTTTLLALTKALATNGTHYARWYSRTDGGTSGISDKPTGSTNAGFVCEAYCNRYNSSSDYRYILECWATTNKSPYTAIVSQDTTSLSWTLLPTTNTTYSSKAAASGGTDVSLVTTGEKYTWNNKQNALATQTAYTTKGSATKVPQITTNTLGQVTGITEVTISQPTVNNGTLTIQKNGTNVQTFSANQSGNATANITVPTKVSDLNNDSNFTPKTYVDNAVAANRGAENPIATILAYAGSEAPDGYLLCRGQAVSRTTYSLLFNAIGTQYGSGDGSTTFNIPDLQGKVIAGLDIVDEDFNVLGKTGGSKTVQLTKNQLPKINGSFTMHGAGSSTPISNVSGDFTSDYNNTKYKNGGTEASGAGSKGNVKLVIGNDEAHENKQPYNTLNYIIKAYSGTDVPVPVESNSVKNSYDDSVANVYSTNYINTKVRGKKLWTNPNPNSSFAAQTITFNETNDYDFYKIKIKYGIDESYAYNWQDVEVGDIFNLLLMWSYTPGMADPNIKGYVGTGFRPECSCNHNSITFTNAVYYTSMDSTKSVNDTSHCIPLEIYGYYI